MARVKIAILGGGSYGWTHTIVRDLCVQGDLEGEIVLEDIDPEPLKLTEPLAKKIAQMAGGRFTISSTTNQTEALTGADFVVLTISTGRLATMYHDLEIPRKYGIHQPVGDTVGPGGLSRGLRNIPVVVDIAKEMEKVCPNAWFFNYTNPMTTLTRCIYKYTSIRAIGLCHELFGTRRTIARTLGVEEEDLDIKVAGVNHFIWILRCTVNGEDALQKMIEADRAGQIAGPGEDTNLVNKTALMDKNRAKMEMLKVFGALPAEGDRHLVEFVPFFLTERANQAANYGVKMTYIADREKGYEDKKAQIHRWLAGEDEIPMAQSREAVSKLISALANFKKGVIDIVNLPNRGQIANLPQDVIVETLGLIGPYEATPLCVGNLPPAIQSMVNIHVQNQEMIVEAAMTGDRGLALQALYNDPLTREFDYVPQMLDELLEANKQYLPRFF